MKTDPAARTVRGVTPLAVAMTGAEMERHFHYHMRFMRTWRRFRRHRGRGGWRFQRLVNRWHGCDVPFNLELPEGTILMHDALGVVIHRATTFTGPCVVFHQVTIGEAWSIPDGAPTIGSHVVIGAGAKVLGPITVGDGAVIGANAIVRKDVPSRAIVVGAGEQVGVLDGPVHPHLYRAAMEVQ